VFGKKVSHLCPLEMAWSANFKMVFSNFLVIFHVF
jgi:hypothetical protein